MLADRRFLLALSCSRLAKQKDNFFLMKSCSDALRSNRISGFVFFFLLGVIFEGIMLRKLSGALFLVIGHKGALCGDF